VYHFLNPVRAKMVKIPEEYQWSSYSYYADKKNAGMALQRFYSWLFWKKAFSLTKKL